MVRKYQTQQPNQFWKPHRPRF